MSGPSGKEKVDSKKPTLRVMCEECGKDLQAPEGSSDDVQVCCCGLHPDASDSGSGDLVSGLTMENDTGGDTEDGSAVDENDVSCQPSAEPQEDETTGEESGSGLEPSGENSGETSEKQEDPADRPDLGERYEVLECIGRGGMGFVYRAHDSATGRIVAVKVMQKELVEDAAALKRFEQEAEAASQLTHPNLVSVYGHGTSPDGAPFIVMDYLEGSGLSEILKKEHHLEPQRALSVFVSVCEALHYAHEQGVIHRDIKPTNVIMTRAEDGSESAHIVDFGIAKAAPTANRETHDLTQTGEIFGSPHYMSPEQCLGFLIDSRSDVYSLGCLMHETLTGAPPFEGANPIQLVVKHINEDPPGFPKRMKGQKMMDRLESVTLRCLEKDKVARYQSVDDVLKDLLAIREGKQPTPYKKSAKPKPTFTRRQMIGLLVASVAVFIYLSALTGMINSAVTGQLIGLVFLILCGSGMYVFYSAALDEYRKNMSAGLSESSAWLITLMVGLGTCCLTGLPAMVTLLMGWSPQGMTLELLEGSLFLHFLCATMTVLVLVCYLIFRSRHLANLLIMPIKYLLTGGAISLLLVFGLPSQTERVLYCLGAAVDATSFSEVSRLLFEASAWLDKKDSAPLVKLADLEKKHHNPVGELRQINRVIARDPGVPIYLVRRAEIFESMGNTKAAIAEYTRLIDMEISAQSRSRVSLFLRRSDLYFKEKMYNDALKDIDKAVALDSRTDEAYLRRGLILGALGRFEEAALEVTRVTYIPSYYDNCRIHVLLGIFLENEHRKSGDKVVSPSKLDQSIRSAYQFVVKHAGPEDSLYQAFACSRLGLVKEMDEALKKASDAARKKSDLAQMLGLSDNVKIPSW